MTYFPDYEQGDLPRGSILYADSSRGQYIPQYFAESIRRAWVDGVSEDDWWTLELGPDNQFYWDAWDAVERDAIVTCPDTGQRYRLHHDGDLWLVPRY